MKLKILIFIDEEIILRHFIMNKTFGDLEKKYNLIYVVNDNSKFSLSNNPILKKFISKDQLRITNISRKRTGRWFLLYIITVLRNQKGSGSHYKARLKNELKRLGRRNLILARIAGLPYIYPIIKYFFIKILGINKEVNDLINAENPSLIIHPSLLKGFYINELFRLKKFKSIPLLVLMNSWDNPSCKSFCTGSPDKLIVWGEQTKNHAIEYMKINENKIECFGAAQFDVYRNPPKENRVELATYFDVNPESKIILYAGSGGAKYETEYLKLLEEGISKSIIPKVHIIYRPHPWRGGLAPGEEDFLSITWKHISIDPTMKDFYKSEIKSPKGRVFLADYENSNKLLTLVDAVISPLSTMLLESIIKGKPVLAFLPEYENNGSSINQAHFAELFKLESINVCREKKDFYLFFNKLFNQIGDKEISSKIINHSQYFVQNNEITYKEQLNKTVDRYLLVNKKN